MKDLSPRARAHLDALRRVDVPESEAKARVWGAVVVRAGAGELGPELPAEPVVPVAGGSTLSIVVGVALGVAVAAGAAALALDDHARGAATPGLGRMHERIAAVPLLAPAPAEPAPAEPTPAEPTAAEPAIVEPVSPPSLPRAEVSPRRAPRVSRAAEDGPGVAAEPGSDPIAEEVALLSAARAALGAGDAKRSIATLTQHAKRFPNGVLAREREVSWITALCALGRDDEATRRAAEFLRRDQDSPHAAKVRASCGAPK